MCGFNDWLLDLLEAEAACHEVVLIQPRTKERQKTDHRDANALGELLWTNRERLRDDRPFQGARRVHIASDQDRRGRRLTSARRRVGAERTRTLNRIQHILQRNNLQHDCPTKGIQTQRALKWLKELELNDPPD